MPDFFQPPAEPAGKQPVPSSEGSLPESALPTGLPQFRSGDDDGDGRQTWGQDYDDAGRVVDREVTPASPPPRDDGGPDPRPEPAAPAAPAVDVSTLERQIHDLQVQLAQQQGAQSAWDQQRIAAEQQRAMAQRAALLQEPDIGDVDEAMSDPKLFREALRKYGEWGQRQAEFRVYEQFSPYLSTIQALQVQQGPQLELLEEAAWERAERRLEQDGVKDAGQYRPRVREMLNGLHPAQALQHRLSPDSLFEAVHYARRQAGAPAPVRGGTGAPPETPDRTEPGDGKPRKTAAMRAVEKRFGVTISDDLLREHAAMRRAG